MILKFPATKRERDLILMGKQLRLEQQEKQVYIKILIIQIKQGRR
jgi:hypothetical protein